MTFLAKLKLWAVAAGGLIFLVGLVLLRAFTFGKAIQRADQIVEKQKEEDIVDDRIEDAVDEGQRVDDSLNDDNGVPVDVREDDGFKRTGRTHRKPVKKNL